MKYLQWMTVLIAGLGLAAVAAAEQRPLLRGRWQQEINSPPLHSPAVSSETWWERLTPPAPRLPALPSPVVVWDKVSGGTQAAWNTTRRAVVAPWQRLQAWSAPSDTRRGSDKPRAWFGWRKTEKQESKPDTLSDWLNQPRPGF